MRSNADRMASGCFLCDPDSELIYLRDDQGFALVGLGPLVPGYTVVATHEHIHSVADSLNDAPSFLSLVERTRALLARRFNRCLLTEHGRMPVCADTMPSERHCYHAHCLLYPGVGSVIAHANNLFHVKRRFDDLRDALGYAVNLEEYYLLSPNSRTAYVLSEKRVPEIPRQLTRRLVAAELNEIEKADWKSRPQRETAERYAQDMRSWLDGEL